MAPSGPHALLALVHCRRRLLHGSAHVKDVTATTDAAGRYEFSFRALS